MKRFVRAERPVGHKPANQSQFGPQKKENSKMSDEKKKNLVTVTRAPGSNALQPSLIGEESKEA